MTSHLKHEAGMTGMALAAGLGTRMRPLTNDRPKPLISVAGRTLLDRTLDLMAACGAGTVVVNRHYLADQIEAHLEMRTGAPDILISDERDQLLETGGGIAKALPLLGNGPVLVCNTDAIFDAEPKHVRELLADFELETEDARLILIPKSRATGLSGAGDFGMTDEGVLIRPEKGQPAPFYYTGMQILNPAIFNGLKVEPFSMWRVWEPALAAGRLTGRVLDADWLHVGDPAGLAEAETRLNRNSQMAAL